MNHVYSAAATALGGRAGFASSSDGRLKVELSTPSALGGDDGPGTNPEQLFAAAQAASLLAAIRKVAGAKAIDIPLDSNVTATIVLEDEDDAGPLLHVALAADIPGVEIVVAHAIVEEALRLCPIARATGERISPVVSVD